MKLAVIGAGPAGLTAAYQLSKANNIVLDVYEASDRVGGLSTTIELWDQKVDLGPHRFFSSDKRVNQLWLEIIGRDYEMVNRLTRIYYKNQYFHYPLKPFDALGNLGLWEASKCVFSFTSEKLNPTKQEGDFESWVTHRFGKRLFEIFFKTYSEKLWGISCKELDADFAAQRIKRLSLYGAIKNALIKDTKNKHKTLVEQFAYPKEGSGMVYQKMKDRIEENGGIVFLKKPVHRVITQRGEAVGLEFKDGTVKEYDHVISTMPISLLVTRLPNVPEPVKSLGDKLTFRSTILVYLNIEGVDLFPDNWLYIHSDDLETGRVTNFRNWTRGLYGDSPNSILALEYWCDYKSEAWQKSDEALIALAKKEIRATGLIKDNNILDGHVHRIPRCYPVYKKGYKEILKPVEDYLSGIKDLSVIGRYGAFKYNNQDHSILMGLLAAENILEGTNHNLWNINTDYDAYQEDSVITETGLAQR